MSRTSKRSKPPPGSNGQSCGRSRLPIFIGICVVALLVVWVLSFYLTYVPTSSNVRRDPGAWEKEKFSHKFRKLSSTQVRRLASLVDRRRLWETFLQPMLIERYPGSPGSQVARQHIANCLSSLSAGWTVGFDTFSALTPRGQVSFSNVMAVLDPDVPRRLLLACHYDSKYFPTDEKGRVFIGASDSAVPCAMLLELVTALDAELRTFKQQRLPLTLQLVFFDGEEAFSEWTPTDSLYGSRHLAGRMAKTKHPSGAVDTTLLDSIDLFVLLDLIGSPDPLFVNHFDNTVHWFDRLVLVEKRLHRLGLLSSHPSEQTYFRKDFYLGPVEDDHVPFLKKGVPVLHLISTPFPPVWHTMDDTEDRLHAPTVDNLTRIMAVFIAEYLGL
ncbi:glutaminyl-peptide cyclotransferase-like [Erpetoichthys calabaricus]|uniref:glutaminyl-peptide cyclotransferase-like n=1 Tax=Erpetoichthys calabaricus TaxID=27687 RepID=UPI002234A25E|nr:glutaminyl-peptide cyclotransferase-like [Erpetoichthys calabaricus]